MDAPAFAEVHDELRAVARDLLTSTSPLVTGGEARPVDRDLVVGTGWSGLEVPDDLGGSGATFAEVAVVVEELGRAADAGPFLGGVVLAVGALLAASPGPGRDALLAGIAEGAVAVAVALPTGPDVGSEPTRFHVVADGDAARVDGGATFVPDAPGADRILLVGRDPARGPVLVDVAASAPGLDVVSTPVVDASRSFADVTADGVVVEASRCWTLDVDPDLLRLRGALAVAIDSLGVAGAALDATVAYAGEREQFGRPIGSFQAVKHQCADVAVDLALARQLVGGAVTALATGDPDASTAVAMAKAHATEAAVRATGTAVQLHGGIGYTWEHGLHVLLKRAALSRSLFGSPASHRSRLAERYRPAAAGPG